MPTKRSPSSPPTLKPGDRAPDFQLTASDGQPIRLDKYHGKRVWLALFRYAACPFCARRVHTLIENYERISEAGLHVIAVFPSPKPRLDKYIARYSPPFPIVPDPDETLYELYGSRTSATGTLKALLAPHKAARALAFAPNSPLAYDGSLQRMPSEFVIGPDQRLLIAHYGRDLDDGIPLESVLGLS